MKINYYKTDGEKLMNSEPVEVLPHWHSVYFYK